MTQFCRYITLFLLLLPLALQAAELPASNKKTFTVYMMLWRGSTDLEVGFADFLRDQRIDVNYVIRDAQRDPAKLQLFIDEAKATRPDLIYAFGTTVVSAIVGVVGAIDERRNITDIPVVYTAVADPVGVGLSRSLNSSGRNLTGVSHVVPLPLQMHAIQRLDTFKKIGFVYNELEANSVAAFHAFLPLAAQAGFSVEPAAIPLLNGKPDAASIPMMIEKLAKNGEQLIYLPSDSFVTSNAVALVNEIHKQHMISFAATEPPIREAGALIGIVSHYYSVGRLAGFKAKQILQDRVPPGDIPLEPISRYSFLVNLDSARALNYYPPVTVLEFAEIVRKGHDASDP